MLICPILPRRQGLGSNPTLLTCELGLLHHHIFFSWPLVSSALNWDLEIEYTDLLRLTKNRWQASCLKKKNDSGDMIVDVVEIVRWFWEVIVRMDMGPWQGEERRWRRRKNQGGKERENGREEGREKGRQAQNDSGDEWTERQVFGDSL